MLMIIIIILLIVIILLIINPRIDIFKDYRDKRHLILWYNNIFNKKREFINFG